MGLEDVSKYPNLFAELSRRHWSTKDLEKLAGRNLIRVFKMAEKVKKRFQWIQKIAYEMTHICLKGFKSEKNCFPNLKICEKSNISFQNSLKGEKY